MFPVVVRWSHVDLYDSGALPYLTKCTRGTSFTQVQPLLHVKSLRPTYMRLYDQSVTMGVHDGVIGKLDVNTTGLKVDAKDGVSRSDLLYNPNVLR